MRLAFAALIFFCAPLFAQFSRPVSYFPYDPVGGCSSNSNLWNNTGGHLYKCRGSSWTIVDGAASSFADLLAGTNTKALTMGTGGIMSYAGGIVNANFLLGVNLSSITGVVKMNTGIVSPVAGSASDCVKVDGSSGACGGLGSLTGVIKATSGTPAVVTGSAGDCVHVDAGSAPCGGASAALTALGTITTAPAIAGGSGTVLTITATLGADITCGTISGFTAGQYLTLKLTQDGTGSRAFTCAGMADLGTVSGIAGKTDVQTFYAPTASTLQAMGPMWCFDCAPAIIIPGLTSGSTTLKAADIASGTLKLPAGSTDFSATGGTSQVVKQVSVGAPLTVGQLACADLSVTCLTANQTVTLGGDAAGAGTTSITVQNTKVNGIAYSATAAQHTVQVTTTANSAVTAKVLPDCPDTGGNHINFVQSGDTFSCGTSGGGGGGAYAASAVSNGTVNQTGSNVSLVSIASVPAMAAGSCRHLNVITDQATAAYNLYLYVDGAQKAQIYGSGGSAWTVFEELFYCNDFGVQNTQKLYTRPTDAFHGGTFNYEGNPSGAPSQVSTAVDWSMSHTVAIFSLGTNATPLAGVLRIED